MDTTKIVRFPTKLRVVHRRLPLGDFVWLGRGAEGEYGWLSEVRALLISDEKDGEKGRILLAAFMDKKPLRCNLRDDQCMRVPSAMCPEDVIAAGAWRRGIAAMGCWLYVSTFPCYWCTLFLVRTGIARLFYAYTRDEKEPPQRERSMFEVNHVKMIRVTF